MYEWRIFIRGFYIGTIICTQTAIEEQLQSKFFYTVQEIEHRIDIEKGV